MHEACVDERRYGGIELVFQFAPEFVERPRDAVVEQHQEDGFLAVVHALAGFHVVGAPVCGAHRAPLGLGTEEGASEHDRTPSESYGSGVASKPCTSVSIGRRGRWCARPGRLGLGWCESRAEPASDRKSGPMAHRSAGLSASPSRLCA
jgi:hypothetical protein